MEDSYIPVPDGGMTGVMEPTRIRDSCNKSEYIHRQHNRQLQTLVSPSLSPCGPFSGIILSCSLQITENIFVIC